MNLKSQMQVLDQPQKNIRALKRLMSRFNQSSLELIQEYRRLEERADHVSNNLESAIALGATRPKISATGEYHDGQEREGSFRRPVRDRNPLTLALLIGARHSRQPLRIECSSRILSRAGRAEVRGAMGANG